MSSDSMIYTYTGRRVDPLALRPEDVDLVDVAHALAALARFNGHSIEFFSVAEHSLDVADRVADLGGTAEERLWGLLHDAAEAYLGDVVSPLKRRTLFECTHNGAVVLRRFSWVEEEVLHAVATRLGLPPVIPAVVHQADGECCLSELDELLNGPGEELLRACLPTMTPAEAEAAWLEAVLELLAEVADAGEAA